VPTGKRQAEPAVLISKITLLRRTHCKSLERRLALFADTVTDRNPSENVVEEDARIKVLADVKSS
jgi:hypothetical protein